MTRAALAEQAAAVTARLSDIKHAERAGELLSLTLREDTRGEAVLVTRRRDVILPSPTVASGGVARLFEHQLQSGAEGGGVGVDAQVAKSVMESVMIGVAKPFSDALQLERIEQSGKELADLGEDGDQPFMEWIHGTRYYG